MPPGRMLDLRALVGDKSDNIPGVKGIGEKGAAALLQRWDSLENLLAHVEEVTPPRARNALANHADDARLSKELSTLQEDVPVRNGRTWRGGIPIPSSCAGCSSASGSRGCWRGSGAVPRSGRRAGSSVTVRTLQDTAALDALVGSLETRPSVPLVLVADGEGPVAGTPTALAFGLGQAEAACLPLGATGIPTADVVERLRPLFGEPSRVAWVGADTKSTQGLLAEQGLAPALPDFDVTLAGQLLDFAGAPGRRCAGRHPSGYRASHLGGSRWARCEGPAGGRASLGGARPLGR